MSRKALFASSNFWTSPSQVGTHSIARALLRMGWQVAFISDPLSPFHFLKKDRSLNLQRFEIYRRGGLSAYQGKLWAYLPLAAFVPWNYPFFRSPLVFKNWPQLTCPNLLHTVRRHGFGKVDLLYFDNSIQPFWLDKIKYKKSLFRIVDNYSACKKYTSCNRVAEKKLAEGVDLILYSAAKLKSYITEFQVKSARFFPNGVDFAHFNRPRSAPPLDYKEIPRPRVVYVGEMETRFDYDLVKAAARRLPAYSFILIGNNAGLRNFFQEMTNVYLLGPKPYEELPVYLQYSDVGIIPYNLKKHKKLIDFVNPLKLHQYFAAGLPVIAARGSELENMQTSAHLYENEDQFVQALREIPRQKVVPEDLFKQVRGLDWQVRVEALLVDLKLN